MKIERIDSPTGRVYKTDVGTFPSVTTILSQTPPPRKAETLEAWMERTPNHVQVKEEAGERGTYIHKRVELALTGFSQPAFTEREVELYVPGFWKSVIPWVRRIKHPLFIEAAICNPDEGYAGTLDLIAKTHKDSYAGAIWDWKTAVSTRREDWVHDYKLQCAAYTVGAKRTFGDACPPISCGHIVIALHDREAQHFELSRADLSMYYKQFRIRCAEYRKLGKGNKVTPSVTKRLFEELGR